MDHADWDEKVRRRAKEESETRVRVGFFGQPGAGKSSLINAVAGQKLAKVGVSTDTTVRSEQYEWNNLLLIDLPGYGTAKFPAETYFEQFDILDLDVVLCITSGKFTDADTKFFRRLAEHGCRCIYVRAICDKIWEDDRTQAELRDEIRADFAAQIGHLYPLLFTSCRTKEGLDDLQKAIRAGLSRAKRDRYVRAAKAYSRDFLEEKRAACRRYATFAVGTAALGSMVPLPGVGVAADAIALGMIVKNVLGDYSIDIVQLAELVALGDLAPALVPGVRELIQLATREGLLWLLSSVAGNLALAEAAKWVPLVGSAVAGSVSFVLMQQLAFHVIDQCHELALAFLDERVDAEAAMA